MDLRYRLIVGGMLAMTITVDGVGQANDFFQGRKFEPSRIRTLGKTQYLPDEAGASVATRFLNSMPANDSQPMTLTVSEAATKKEPKKQVDSDLASSDLKLLSQQRLVADSAKPNTTVETKKVVPPTQRVLIFKAVWCGACQGLNSEFPKLEAVKWKVGSAESNHFQVVDADARPDLLTKYGVTLLPTILLVENDRVVSRHGYLNAVDLAELYHRRLR